MSLTPVNIQSKNAENSPQIGKNAVEILRQTGNYASGNGIAPEIFSDSTGLKNSVNSGLTDADFDTDHFYISQLGTEYSHGSGASPSTLTNSAENSGIVNFNGFFSSVSVRKASGTTTLRVRVYKNSVVVADKNYIHTTSDSESIPFTQSDYTETFEVGDEWEILVTYVSGTSNRFYKGTSSAQSYEGFSLNYTTSGIGSSTIKLQSMTPTSDAEIVCDTNLLTLDDDDTNLNIYAKLDIESNTEIKIDVTDGTTTISDKELNSDIDISSLTGGNLEIKFKLHTDNYSNTPKIYEFSAVATK